MKPNSGANLDHLQNESDTDVTIRDPLIGSVLAGHIELISRVGLGGMSVVYKAKDMLLNRMVAVKILLPHVAFDPRGIRRFRQEALAVSKLDHPNIIRVYEFQIPEDGQPFLVMDLIEGQSLEDFINKNGPIESRRAISILAQVCTGLEHAHKYGVIHRDLKPGNIMLLKDPESKRQVVKIVDFGLAKMLLDENDTSQGLTRTGDIFGSPLYMCPEQCSGAPLDVRSDVYSLGCVMYEILTGLPPLKGKTVLETIQMQIGQYPVPLAQVNHRIRMVGRLDSVLFKAMAKDPAQRYQTIEEFRHALEDIKISTPDDGFFDRLKLTLQIRQSKARPGSGFKTIILLTVTTLLLIAAAVALIINFKHSGIALPQILTGEMAQQKWSQLDEEAERLFDDGQYAQAQRNFADELKLAEHLDPKYEKASLEGLLDASYVIHGDGNEAATTEWRSRLAAINATMIDSRQMNDELLKVQSPKEAKETIGKAIALAVRMKKAEKSWLADKLLDTAVNVGKRFLGAKDALLAECLSTQADMYQIQESHGDKELQLRTQAEAIREANKQGPLALAMAQMELANIYYRKGIKDQTQTWAKPDYWYGKAIESFKNSQSTHNKLEDQHYGEIARCECELASCEGNLKHVDESLNCLKRSREYLEKLTPGMELDSLPVPMLKNLDWHLLTCENWNLWADLEKQKRIPDQNKEAIRDTIKEKTFDYLTKALSAANSELDKPYPIILLCEENLAQAQSKMLPRRLHCLAIRVRLDEPVHDQLDTIKKIYDCYAGMAGQERKAREYASILVNAGQKQYNPNLAYFSLKLKMDLREALKYAMEGVRYRKNHYDKVVLKQTKHNDEDDDRNDDNDYGWENENEKFPYAYEKLKLACALLVEAEAYVATGDKGMSESPLNEATKLLKPYTSKRLQDENLGATLGLYQKATDVQKQLQRQLSSKH